jgi:hypothetical protein
MDMGEPLGGASKQSKTTFRIPAAVPWGKEVLSLPPAGMPGQCESTRAAALTQEDVGTSRAREHRRMSNLL